MLENQARRSNNSSHSSKKAKPTISRARLSVFDLGLGNKTLKQP